MVHIKPDIRYSRILASLALIGLVAAAGAGQALAGGWFKAAGGLSGMAMDDVNDGEFRFYDYTIEGYNFPDLDSGFSMSFHLGFDLSPDFSLGFSWDRQHGHVKGTDVDVTANLKLDANLFMGQFYWSPLRTGPWSFGGAAGMGLIFPAGHAKLTGQNNVNYGEGDITGSSGLAFQALALATWAFGGSSAVELTVGYRVATIDEIRARSATVLKADGTNLELDYTGYVIKVGYKFVFGGGEGDQARPDIN